MDISLIKGRGLILSSPLKTDSGLLENVFLPFNSVQRVLKDSKNNGTCAYTIRIQDLDGNIYHFGNYREKAEIDSAFLSLIQEF